MSAAELSDVPVTRLKIKIVDIKTASNASKRTMSSWLEIAYGTSHELSSTLGGPEVGEFLPGLGTIAAWGFVEEGDDEWRSGAIYTGFDFDPDRVSIVATSSYQGSLLSPSCLGVLLELPKDHFTTLTIRSLLRTGTVPTLRSGGCVVLQTRSQSAGRISAAAAAHLVRDSNPTFSEEGVEESPELYVQSADERHVSRFTSIVDEEHRWVRIDDWGVSDNELLARAEGVLAGAKH